jgi:tetratricopeptide (TPR) repeat protein
MIRNAVGSATDSLRDVLAIVLGRVQRTQGRYVVEEGREALTKIGGNVLTEVSSIHDPMLERYVGRQVVIEVLEDGEIHEHVGLFKEYSADFLHVLDVQYPHNRYVEVEPDGTAEADAVTAAYADRRLRLTNRGEQPLLVISITVGDHSQMVNAIVDAGRTIDLRVAAAEPETARVHVQTARELDIIVPRSRCVVRHRAEKPASRDIGEYVWDVVFDLGTLIRRDGPNESLEARLRKDLADDPGDATAAANLGAVLIKKREFPEAEKWLRAALRFENRLPDGGRRVRMQLRELARRVAQRQGGPSDSLRRAAATAEPRPPA